MNDAEKKALWEKYSKDRSAEIREKLIVEYVSLVKVVAGRLSMYLGHNVEYCKKRKLVTEVYNEDKTCACFGNAYSRFDYNCIGYFAKCCPHWDS